MAIALDQNYETTPAEEHKPFERPPSGGYILEVVEAEEGVSSKGNPMVTFSMDIAEGPHKGVFQKFPIKFYQLVTGEQTARFKGVMKAFSESNSPDKMRPVIGGGSLHAEKLKGARIGGCLRDEEYMNRDGVLKTSCKIAFLCSAQRVKDGEVDPMPVKRLEGPASNHSTARSTPPHSEDDLPNW